MKESLLESAATPTGRRDVLVHFWNFMFLLMVYNVCNVVVLCGFCCIGGDEWCQLKGASYA